MQGRLNRSPPFQRRAGRHGQARCWFDTRHAPSGWRQALPWACPVPPAGGHGELVFPAVDSAGRSVGAGRRNRPCVTRLGIAPARGRPAWAGLQRRLPCAGRIQPVERGADLTTGKRPRHGSGYGARDSELSASGRGSEHAPGDAGEPPRRPSASPHDRRTCNRPETGPRLPRSLSRSPLPSNWLFEVSRRQRKPFSRPRPRRPKGPGLILSVARRDLAGAARLLCNFHACGPAPGSTPGSVGAQVLTFGITSVRLKIE